MRPDNRMPLIGDADGSQIIPIVKRDVDDVAYLLSLGAVLLNDEKLKLTAIEPEVAWLFGEEGVSLLQKMGDEEDMPSNASPDAGAYLMRDGDLHLHFNANDCGVNGRGSHGHNDALSIEISAFGRPFIVDPGSYVYNLDREARQAFRSTAYHSTVMVDGVEQNTTEVEFPFIMGNEAKPSVTQCQMSPERDLVSARHNGYTRLAEPVIHERSVEFNKTQKYWVITDDLSGKGSHEFTFGFHLALGVTVAEIDDLTVKIADADGRSLNIRTLGLNARPETILAFVSRNYGHREPSTILSWKLNAAVPLHVRFLIVPSVTDENVATRLELLDQLADNIDT
jgi:hypothetical protein